MAKHTNRLSGEIGPVQRTSAKSFANKHGIESQARHRLDTSEWDLDRVQGIVPPILIGPSSATAVMVTCSKPQRIGSVRKWLVNRVTNDLGFSPCPRKSHPEDDKSEQDGESEKIPVFQGDLALYLTEIHSEDRLERQPTYSAKFRFQIGHSETEYWRNDWRIVGIHRSEATYQPGE